MPAVLSRPVSPALPAAAGSTEAAEVGFNSNEQSLAELDDTKAPLATADMDGSAPLVYDYVPDADALPEDREDLDLVALPAADQQAADADSERTGQTASVSQATVIDFDATPTRSGNEIAEEMTRKTRRKLQKDWKRIRRWAKKNELQEADLMALWSRAEEEMSAKQSKKLRLDREAAAGERLTKRGEWRSRSLRQDLLASSSVETGANTSWLGICFLRAATTDVARWNAFMMLLKCDVGEFALDIHVVLREAPRMKDHDGPGIYCLRSREGLHYIGVSINCKQRHGGHMTGTVNHKFRSLNEDRRKWHNHILFAFDDNDTSTIMYAIEMLFNILSNATSADVGLNVNVFDCLCYAAIATRDDVRRIWKQVVSVLENNSSLKIVPPATTTAAGTSFWRQINCAPLRPLTVHGILIGWTHKPFRLQLQKEMPLPATAFVQLPKYLLSKEERHAHAQRKEEAVLYRLLKLAEDGSVTFTEKNAPTRQQQQQARAGAEAAVVAEESAQAALAGTSAGETAKRAAELRAQAKAGGGEKKRAGSGPSSSTSRGVKKQRLNL